MMAEADALQKLSEVTAQLEKYQTVYGDPSTLPPEVSNLADQLKQKESEIQRLRLLDTQRGQVSCSLQPKTKQIF
jgi:E3 ubiquitin-protein ligase BRE1